MKTVEVVVLLVAEFAVVETCTASGFNITSLNGTILEALGNPLTIS